MRVIRLRLALNTSVSVIHISMPQSPEQKSVEISTTLQEHKPMLHTSSVALDLARLLYANKLSSPPLSNAAGKDAKSKQNTFGFLSEFGAVDGSQWQ